jgi:hypothetical protein
MRAIRPAVSSSPFWSFHYLTRNKNYEAPHFLFFSILFVIFSFKLNLKTPNGFPISRFTHLSQNFLVCSLVFFFFFFFVSFCDTEGSRSCLCAAIKIGLCWSGRDISISEQRDLAASDWDTSRIETTALLEVGGRRKSQVERKQRETRRNVSGWA